MRRIILLAVAAALMVGGGYLLAFEMITARIIFGKLVFAGAFMMFIGGYLLWDDFIRPALTGHKRGT